MMSRELRNPLAAIISGLSLLGVLVDEQKTKIARDIIVRQANQLRRFVNDLLDISRITNNKIELKKEKVELNKLAILVIEDYKTLYENKGVKLKIETAESSIYLEADSTRITQILSNLLHNSLKFTESGGETVVSINKINDEAIICIIDNGCGIRPEDLPKLFKPFMQVDASLDRKNAGLGLGLSIVKHMVELHGGTVSIFSEGLKKGTQLIICLPLSINTKTEKEDNQ